MMKQAKVGIVGLCSHIESGAERFDVLIASAAAAIEAAGMEAVAIETPVYSPLEAVEACSILKQADVDLVAMMDVTWVCDSLKYVFVQEMKRPVLLWAVPYTETFSIGCVQNFGSVLTTEKIHYEYVYGLPSEAEVIEKVHHIATAAQIVRKFSNLRIAVLGPRQTFRVAGPQDMSIEEWEFSRTFGPTILHLEMEELTDAAEAIRDEDAVRTLSSLKDRTGKTLCTESCMIHMAKLYMAAKAFVEKNGIDVIAAECYPLYGGLLNQTSSWLEDDGYIVDTEGDVANGVLKYMLNMAAGGGTCALGEAGSFDDVANFLCVAHEGSSPASMAASRSEVQVSPSGENGCFVGFPVKAMEHCTICDFQGSAGQYQMLVASGSVLPATREEWVTGGEKQLIKLRFDNALPSQAVDTMLHAGLHHHLVVKEGNLTEIMQMACAYLGIEIVRI